MTIKEENLKKENDYLIHHPPAPVYVHVDSGGGGDRCRIF
jgi:hypothetical protein